ncbi:MAG TPA: PHB depolymerase family esterase [Casimicrobiaceae bacterium]
MLGRLLARLRAFLARLFRREVAPGRFESGSAGSWQGFVSNAPAVLPRRDYLLYVPRAHSRWRRYPVLVLCHGCRQTPEEFVAATRIVDVADEHGWLVLLPRQKESANAWRCWNWFDTRTSHGNGEAAIVLSQLEDVIDDWRGDRERVVVAGMSAGGALAAALALRHASRVRGVFVHSGLPCGAAGAPIGALGVMQRGPDNDVEAIARDVRRAWPQPMRLPLCIVHGEADDVVAPVNAIALARQFLRLNEHAALVRPLPPDATEARTLPPPDVEMREIGAPERTIVTREWRADGKLVVRYVSVGGLGHAWSGGDAAYPYNDERPPPATEILERFAVEVAG